MTPLPLPPPLVRVLTPPSRHSAQGMSVVRRVAPEPPQGLQRALQWATCMQPQCAALCAAAHLLRRLLRLLPRRRKWKSSSGCHLRPRCVPCVLERRICGAITVLPRACVCVCVCVRVRQTQALAAHRAEMDAFVARHVAAGTPIAVVTSGGTAVPLERNTVRFLDNFSTGTRGSCCTEALLRAGYAVIMVRRTGSVQPLRRETAKFVSAMDASLSPDGSTVVLPPAVRRELLAARSVSAAGTLMEVPFVSVSDYLHVLKAASEAVAVAGPAAMTLLAAAVSDFYVPEAAMAEHKIQSRGGASGLQLDLVGVPKTLGVLRHVWAPDAFMVSFKLETDAGILMKKAHGALAAYGMNCVVANLLPTRYTEVHIVDAHSAEVVRRPPSSASDGSGGIEELFIRRLVARHQAHMGRQK